MGGTQGSGASGLRGHRGLASGSDLRGEAVAGVAVGGISKHGVSPSEGGEVWVAQQPGAVAHVPAVHVPAGSTDSKH